MFNNSFFKPVLYCLLMSLPTTANFQSQKEMTKQSLEETSTISPCKMCANSSAQCGKQAKRKETREKREGRRNKFHWCIFIGLFANYYFPPKTVVYWSKSWLHLTQKPPSLISQVVFDSLIFPHSYNISILKEKLKPSGW